MELVAIGRFARLTGLTIRAVRHYGELGLLEPALVDEATGYRYYGRGQVETAARIRRLRELELPLDQVRLVLAEPARLRECLIAHRAFLEQRAARTGTILAELTHLIDGKEQLVKPAQALDELAVQEYPDQPVLSIRERVHLDEVKHVIPAAYRELFAYLRELGATAVEPWTTTVCPFADDAGVLEIENAVHTATSLPGRGRIESRTLPACTAVTVVHKGPYTELGRSYRGLESWLDAHELDTAGDPREIYVTDPEEVADPADYLTVIAWPIRPEQAARAREAACGVAALRAS
jgi:effector-binding domain-containing protein